MSEPSVQHLFNSASQHHRAGRLAEAEQLYRQVLSQQPRHANALSHLGMIAYQVSRHDIAIELINRAITISPEVPEYQNNLALVLAAQNRLTEAIATERYAIKLCHDFVEAHVNLGNFLRAQGRLVEAIAAFREAVRINPQLADAHNNLGNALREQGDLAGSITAHRKAIDLRPDYAEAMANLGAAFNAAGQRQEALAVLQRAIEINPGLAAVYNNLGNVLRALGRLDDAASAYRQAVSLDSRGYEPQFNLLRSLRELKRLDEAIAVGQTLVEAIPGSAEAHNLLGSAFRESGRLDDALAAYRRASDVDPSLADAHNNQGLVLAETGQIEQAIACCRRAVDLRPADPALLSNLLFLSHFSLSATPQSLARDHAEWNRRFVVSLRSKIRPPRNLNRDPDRRLRIGFISPHFRDHSASSFSLPLLTNLDRSQFEAYCYSNSQVVDDITRQIRQSVAAWREIAALSDDQAAELIREDQIDILVDLVQHMPGNRLLVVARRPAPVQAAWLGYPSITGVQTIDFRITDQYLDPPGETEGDFERPIRLKDSFWCFTSLDRDPPEVNDLPAERASGRITFGCFNSFNKVNDEVLDFWARVITSVPESRLILLCDPGSHRDRTLARLQAGGVDFSRVEFTPRLPRREYLRLYNRIDVALDTFPYPGHTTTIESLWMGVPIVTLTGATSVSRGGASVLNNLGLQRLVTSTREECLKTIVELCGDLPRLATLRAELRGRMETSALMDGPRFAREMGAVFRAIWRERAPSSRPSP